MSNRNLLHTCEFFDVATIHWRDISGFLPATLPRNDGLPTHMYAYVYMYTWVRPSKLRRCSESNSNIGRHEMKRDRPKTKRFLLALLPPCTNEFLLNAWTTHIATMETDIALTLLLHKKGRLPYPSTLSPIVEVAAALLAHDRQTLRCVSTSSIEAVRCTSPTNAGWSIHKAPFLVSRDCMH